MEGVHTFSHVLTCVSLSSKPSKTFLKRIRSRLQSPLSDDSVLMDMGMDSLTSVAFRNDLQLKLGLDLPVTRQAF